MMSATWLNNMSLIVSPLNNNNLASKDKSAFVGAMGSSTTYQRPWEQSYSPVCWVIVGTPTLVLLWTLQGPGNWLQPLVASVWAALKNTGLDNHLWVRGPLWKSRLWVKFQHTILTKKKNTSLDALERVRRTIWLYLCHPSPKVTQLSTNWELTGLWFLAWGKVRA